MTLHAHLSRTAVALLLAGVAVAGHAQRAVLPERVDTVAKGRVAAGIYKTLVIAVVDGEATAIYALGKFDNRRRPRSRRSRSIRRAATSSSSR